MRDIKYYTFYEVEPFEKECLEELDIVCNHYKFYYSNDCHKITKDINTVISKKPDFYTHRVTLYYDSLNIYLVVYTKKFIIVEVLMKEEMDTNRYVHGLLRKFEPFKTILDSNN